MRFVELSLLAYGGFRERRFDLSQPGPAFHLLYGANEAGKSTALRAILGLLYGIDRRTPDAYLHGNANLRIGARLRDASGQELALLRRKGDKDTLLDASGAVIEESRLQRMLAGMQESVFRSMFGLDHARLRAGGEQLRLGRGDLGESLFQAGVGASGIHAVLRGLSQEADELFRPRGHKRLLNAEIEAYRSALRQIGEHGKRADSLRLQEQELARVEQQRAELHRKRAELQGEQGMLERIKRVLPKLAQRRELTERRAQLGPQPLLPEDCEQLRRDAAAERYRCESELAQLARAREILVARRAALSFPETLLALSSEFVRGVANRLGSHMKAEADLPKVRTELRVLEQDALAALRALGDPVALPEIEGLRVDVATSTSIGKLAREHSGLCERVQAAARDLEAAQGALRHAGAELAQLRRTQAAAGDELPAPGSLPAPATLEAFRRRFEREEAARDKQADAEQALAARESAVAQQLDRIAREGSPPSERDLLEARAQRDAAFAALRTSAAASESELRAYEALVVRADGLADRLRREANRVAELARFEAERDAIARERMQAERRTQALAQATAGLGREWDALWEPLGIAPRSPGEMQPLLSRVSGLLESGDRGRAEAQRRLSEAQAALERWQAQWAGLMTRLRLRADASVEEAQAVHDEQRRLFEKVDRMEQLRTRIEAMERDRRNFERELSMLVARHLPELGGLSLEQAAEQLVRRHGQALRDRELGANLDEQLAEAESQRIALGARMEQAVHALSELMRIARVAELSELEQVEQHCRQSRELEAGLAELERDLLELGEGAGIDELAAQAAELSGDRVRARLEDVKDELEALETERQELDHQIGSLRKGLELVKRDDLAAQAAAEAEQHLARLKSHAQSYVRKRLAAELLQRELRRYRDANQGPIVGRASGLFARLTLGRYPKLQVGYDDEDEPVLQCVDEQGTRINVESLSDGARDQLYLALRLASLERFAERNEPMPLVLDDVLIHFDEQRSRAALGVLGEFSATTQVLFFTHNARLVELAREAIPADRLFEHGLHEQGRHAPSLPAR